MYMKIFNWVHFIDQRKYKTICIYNGCPKRIFLKN